MMHRHVKCTNPNIKAEDIEPKILNIIKQILSHKDIVNGRLDNIVKAHVYLNNSEIQVNLDNLNEALRVNLSKQSKLNDSYMENLIGIEIYKDKVSLLREEENMIKGEIAKAKIRLIEKEQSGAYLRILNLAIANFDESSRKMDLIQKKEILRLIFKSVEINDGQIVSVRLYQPFQKIYEEMLKECNILMEKKMTTEGRQDQEVCILLPSADRWFRSHRTILPFLEEIYQDKLAELTTYIPRG